MAVMVETPPTQTIDGTSDPARYEELRRTLDQLDSALPDGYRAEIIGGNIVMSPWSRGAYLRVMRSMIRQLAPHAPEGHEADSSPCLFSFPGHESDFGPDIHVSDADLTDIESIHLPGEALSLVGELTSTSTARFDRHDKVEVYGKAGVPVYVLVDMLKNTVVVYSEPSGHGYRTSTRIEFGGAVHIPAPFDCKLDTADWKA